MRGTNDTIVAISTPTGEGGIGIVRLSGKKALKIAGKMFIPRRKKKISSFKTYTVHYGHVVRPFKGKPTLHGIRDARDEIIDEVILTVMKAPKSYTKEDIVEINCHGGIVPLKMTLEETVRLGARIAEPGEFTKRAFLNGRIDLAQAEGVSDLINAKTEASSKVALSHLEGEFSIMIRKNREALLDLLKDVEAGVDFSHEDIEFSCRSEFIKRVKKAIGFTEKILEAKDTGIILREGITCVICGKPNVGKSSLLNTLLRRNRAIVTDMPGTTRDIIEELINIDGVAVRIVDTAGMTKGKNLVEKKSVELTRAYLKKGDIVIFMLDMSRPFSRKDKEVIGLLPRGKTIIVGNKSDLKQKLDVKKIGKIFPDEEILKVSLLKKKNIAMIEKVIGGKIWEGRIMHPEPSVLNNIRHKRALEDSLKALKEALAAFQKGLPPEIAAIDIREAIFRAGLITGESVDVNILDRIFDKFCVGK